MAATHSRSHPSLSPTARVQQLLTTSRLLFLLNRQSRDGEEAPNLSSNPKVDCGLTFKFGTSWPSVACQFWQWQDSVSVREGGGTRGKSLSSHSSCIAISRWLPSYHVPSVEDNMFMFFHTSVFPTVQWIILQSFNLQVHEEHSRTFAFVILYLKKNGDHRLINLRPQIDTYRMKPKMPVLQLIYVE